MILLDCGWTVDSDPKLLKKFTPCHSSQCSSPSRELLSSLDAVLISHADFEHMGALPFIQHMLPCSIYVTDPVWLLAESMFDDFLKRKHDIEDFRCTLRASLTQ